MNQHEFVLKKLPSPDGSGIPRHCAERSNDVDTTYSRKKLQKTQ